MIQRANIFLMVVFSLIFACCGKHSERHVLSEADRMLSVGKSDSAYHVLNKINSHDLNDEDKALYCLLMTQAMYGMDMESEVDTLIDCSIKYYTGRDNAMLAESYYYKGVVNYAINNADDAMICLKKAESLSSGLPDKELYFKILAYISRINFKSENYSLALKYGKESLLYAEKNGKPTFIALTYNLLACIFEKLGNNDSAYVYVMKNIKFADGIKSDKSKAIMYANIADYYSQKGETKLYEKYLNKSSSLYVLPDVLNRYALIKYNEGKFDEADSLWNKALAMSDGKGKVEILETIISNLKEEDNYKILYNCYKQLDFLKDSIRRQQHTQQIQDIQLRYDNDMMKRKYDVIVTRIAIVLVAVFLLSVIFILLLKYKQKQNKTKLLQSQILIDSYNKQIEEYKKSGKDNTRKIKMLEKKLSSVYSEQTDVFTRGRACYWQILDNGSVVTWKKDDYIDFIEYYKLVNLSFVVQIEREYKSLTHGNKFLLILQDMGKTETELQKILGTTIGTIRVQQSRIRKKYIGDSACV